MRKLPFTEQLVGAISLDLAIALALGDKFFIEGLILLEQFPKLGVLALDSPVRLPEFLIFNLEPNDLFFERLVLLLVALRILLDVRAVKQAVHGLLAGVKLALALLALHGGIGQYGLRLVLQGIG